MYFLADFYAVLLVIKLYSRLDVRSGEARVCQIQSGNGWRYMKE